MQTILDSACAVGFAYYVAPSAKQVVAIGSAIAIAVLSGMVISYYIFTNYWEGTSAWLLTWVYFNIILQIIIAGATAFLCVNTAREQSKVRWEVNDDRGA